MDSISKAKNGIYGHNLKDAMGVPLKFSVRNLKNPVTKMLEYGSHNVAAGTWFDDTSIVLVMMD